MKTPEQRQATDRRNALTDAADPIAEYLVRIGYDDDAAGSSEVITKLMTDLLAHVGLRLHELAEEAAREAALDAKAEELGLRY